MARASIPQPVLPRGFRQLGAFEQGSGSSWQTLVARVEEEIASPAPTALPAGSRCVLKRRECAGIGVAEQLVRDVRPLSVLQHPHVVRYFGVALSPGATDVLLVCEFCARGSLLDLIYHHRRSTGEGGGAGLTSRHRAELLAPELVLEILVQLSAGLKYLHDEMSLAHGNLTAANVLLDGTGVVKLTDVGLEDALDSADYTSSRDAREDALRRGARGGRVYWAPERSLSNAANGGFLPSGPSAPADCWAMGCVASELVTGVFVQERLASTSSLSLAEEPRVVEALLRAVADDTCCGQCGQTAAKGGDSQHTCAGCRTSWVAEGLMARDPMRRLEAGRAAFLLETPTWVSAPDATRVGRTVVPPLSIPPPSQRRRGDSAASEESATSQWGALPGVDILSAVRRAIDGPDWRVFKDGKLVPNESQWRHDDLTTERSCERRAPSPHPRAMRGMYAEHNGQSADEHATNGSADPHTVPTTPRSARQRERAERQQTRRGLADLYLQAKQRQLAGAENDSENTASRSANHAIMEQQKANGVDGGMTPVPLSSLKEDKAKRRGAGNERSDARVATLSSVTPSTEPLTSLPSPDVPKRQYDMQAQDVWHAWLKSLGADVPYSADEEEEEEEEDAPSQSASGAHGASDNASNEDEDAFEVGEMGPQEVVEADMQVHDFVSPRVLAHETRSQRQGGGAVDGDAGLAMAGGQDELEDAARGRRGWKGGRGEERYEPAGGDAGSTRGGDDASSALKDGDDDANDLESRAAASRLADRHEEAAAASKTQNFLSQHLVSVTNVAGNTVHVIGAAAPAPASEEESDAQSAPSRPHSQSTDQLSSAAPSPHPSPEEEEDKMLGVPEEGRGGIVAKGAGGAEVEIKAELLTCRSVGGDGGSGVGAGGGREVYTVFVLGCEGAGVEWQVSRRYSEFAELHLKLMSTLPPAKGRASRARAALSSRMPKKVMFGSNSPHVVAERLEKLRSYVAAVQRVLALTNPSDAEKACEAWVHFCAVPSTAFAAASLWRSRHGNVPSSPPHTGAVKVLRELEAFAKPPLRGVLRRGAFPAKGQEGVKSKRVVVEEGRRQVVWGTDGVLQLDANTFISGTPERVAGPTARTSKKGNKQKPRLVDPAGPFALGWWQDEALSDPPAQTGAGDAAQGSPAVDPAGTAAQPASKHQAMAPDSNGCSGAKGAAQAGMGKANAEANAKGNVEATAQDPVLPVRTDAELSMHKQDAQDLTTLSLLRDLDHVSRGRGPDREDRQQTKEQMNKALPLSSSHLSTESSANAPAWSHEATAFRTQWPAGRSEPGREQDKGPTCAPTCLHEATGRDLGTASSTPGASASSWMSMRMAGRFGPPLSTSDGPGRSHGTVSSRAAGETHAEITVEMRAARAAAPLGLGGLKDNSAIATGADGTGDVRAESSSLPVRTPKVGETNTPPLEQDEDLVQMEESLRMAKQVFAQPSGDDAAPLAHKLGNSDSLLAMPALRHATGSDQLLGASLNGFSDHALAMDKEDEEEAVGLSANELAALGDLNGAATAVRKHDLEARLSQITQMLAHKTDEDGAVRGPSAAQDHEAGASGRSRWTNASVSPKALPSVTAAPVSDWTGSTVPRPRRKGDGSSRDSEAGIRWSAVKAPSDSGGGVSSASLPLHVPSLPAESKSKVAGGTSSSSTLKPDISEVLHEVGGRLELEQARRQLSLSLSTFAGDVDLVGQAENGSLHSPASSSPRAAWASAPMPPSVPAPPSQVEHQRVRMENADEDEHAAYEPASSDAEEGTPGWGSESINQISGPFEES